MKRLILNLIKFYQKTLAKKVGGHCVFVPSCSVYAIEAIEKYGFWKAIFMIWKRILRCRPPNGGYDFP